MQTWFKPWGGLQLELSGDVNQLPPVRATSLASTLQLPVDPRALQQWKYNHAKTLRGHHLWTQIRSCIILTYSHRCQGILADLLSDMFSNEPVSDSAWAALQAPCLTHPSAATARTEYLSGKFALDTCPVAVLRHTIHVQVCLSIARPSLRSKCSNSVTFALLQTALRTPFARHTTQFDAYMPSHGL